MLRWDLAAGDLWTDSWRIGGGSQCYPPWRQRPTYTSVARTRHLEVPSYATGLWVGHIRLIVIMLTLSVLTLSGDNSEFMVLSANTMRSDFRHKLANLIHIMGSSSGLSTRVRTWSIRCQTSTSG